jgi:hypothetical protein
MCSVLAYGFDTDWQLAQEINAHAIMLEKLERGSRRAGKNSPPLGSAERNHRITEMRRGLCVSKHAAAPAASNTSERQGHQAEHGGSGQSAHQ